MSGDSKEQGDAVVVEERWDPPGPGTWTADESHFTRTITPLIADLMAASATAGVEEGMELVGAPLRTMEVRFVEGQMYRKLVPIVGGDSGPKRPPPPWLSRLAFKVVPALRRRARLAADALENKSFRDEAERWEMRWRPDLVEANRAFAAIDLASLSEVDLADHLERLIGHLAASIQLHFRLHISDLGPIGFLLDATREWGIDDVDAMAMLAGASPETSAPHDELGPIARTVAAAGVDVDSLTALEAVRAVSDEVAGLLDAYLVDYGARLTGGYDIVDLTLAEMPEVILASLRDDRHLTGRTAAAEAEERGQAAISRLRERVPVGERDRFDELVADARRLYGLRDENGPITYEWPAGVLRTSLLELGTRAVDAGHLLEAAHVMELERGEVDELAHGRLAVGADEVAARRPVREARRGRRAPMVLGPDPVEPDLAGLPDEMATMMRISIDVVELLEATPDVAALSGTGIGTESYRGRARVVADADEALLRIEPGDVIVTRLTVPTFNSVLAVAGAVVTEHGGLLCHTAVIARELGIPAVVGASGALDLPDGAEVEVDPVAGVVTVL
ncbi:MAG: PEP-utilizing enzyme [Actinomycetota bacterium]